MNNQHALLKFSKLFRGIANAATVYARPILREALELNAATVILSHTHRGLSRTPSTADLEQHAALCKILALIDVTVLDNIIISNQGFCSFKQNGLL